MVFAKLSDTMCAYFIINLQKIFICICKSNFFFSICCVFQILASCVVERKYAHLNTQTCMLSFAFKWYMRAEEYVKITDGVFSKYATSFYKGVRSPPYSYVVLLNPHFVQGIIENYQIRPCNCSQTSTVGRFLRHLFV